MNELKYFLRLPFQSLPDGHVQILAALHLNSTISILSASRIDDWLLVCTESGQ